MPALQYGKRPKTAARGYDADWKKLRDQFLREHPICECDDCMASGAIVPSEVVDHRKPIAERPDLRLVWSNLRAMSKAHHDSHTAREQGFAKSSKGKPRFTDASGCPEGWGSDEQKGRGGENL
jgi:5-methylcytosine-specific restriction protein A